MSDEYWESVYESGDFKHWESVYPSPELVALVAAQMLTKNARVLDVGCGGGNDAIFMAQSGFKVIGVDVSCAALKIAEERAAKTLVKVNWLHASVLELPIGDCSIDCVTDRGLFHLIADEDRPRYAAELFRVLKIQGRVLIRGASEKSAEGRFNPVTKKAIIKYFSNSKFRMGKVLPIPLYSVVGEMDANIVMLQKISAE
jgi:ubiquinone/menaquinone biosynthesis C-methylase UbiE